MSYTILPGAMNAAWRCQTAISEALQAFTKETGFQVDEVRVTPIEEFASSNLDTVYDVSLRGMRITQ